jgi:hypothetical protein
LPALPGALDQSAKKELAVTNARGVPLSGFALLAAHAAGARPTPAVFPRVTAPYCKIL